MFHKFGNDIQFLSTSCKLAPLWGDWYISGLVSEETFSYADFSYASIQLANAELRLATLIFNSRIVRNDSYYSPSSVRIFSVGTPFLIKVCLKYFTIDSIMPEALFAL